MSNVSSFLPSLLGPVLLENQGVALPARPNINFRTGLVASDDGTTINVDASGITGVQVAGENITNTLDAKIKPTTALANLPTVSTALATLLTVALGTLTGVCNIVGRLDVTDATGVNVGTWSIDLDVRMVAGTPTLIYPGSLAAAVTSRGKNGAIAGTEVSVVLSGTNVLIKVTPPSSTAYTWTIHALTQTSVP